MQKNEGMSRYEIYEENGRIYIEPESDGSSGPSGPLPGCMFWPIFFMIVPVSIMYYSKVLFWFYCVIAIIFRFLIWEGFVENCDQIKCTKYGLIAVVISYLEQWTIFSDIYSMDSSGDLSISPFWARLIWGLLL